MGFYGKQVNFGDYSDAKWELATLSRENKLACQLTDTNVFYLFYFVHLLFIDLGSVHEIPRAAGRIRGAMS